MAVDTKDRAAYEEGVERSKMGAIEHFILKGVDMIPGPSRSESEQAAFEKGDRGEQLDEDKKEESSGPCYLSTACVIHSGLRDNCPELLTLRSFRDNYVTRIPGGQHLISEYYATAPAIIAAIEQLPEPAIWYRRLYEDLVRPTVQFVQAQRNEEALTTYRRYVEMLRSHLFPSSDLETRSEYRASNDHP